MMSGGRIDWSVFRSGWVLKPRGSAAHFMTREGRGIQARCGVSFVPTMRDGSGYVAFEPGTFPRCKRCEVLRARRV